jgi:putative two-component system hydrogenase maturation factor HypX/HoxX
MLGLGADVVVGRSGVMLNPYYDIGLYGSELHTLTLPHRVGHQGAATLLSAKLPISTDRAAAVGLVDLVGPADPAEFREWLEGVADRYTDPAAWRGVIYSRIPVDRPLDYYESLELAEMARDVYDDAHGFAAARRSFVDKKRFRPASAGLVVSGDRTDFDDFMDDTTLRDMWSLAPHARVEPVSRRRTQ